MPNRLNGTGKTSLLRALVLAFTGYDQNETMGLSDEVLTDRLRNLMRIIGVNNSGNPQYPKEGGFAEVSYQLEREDGADETPYKNQVLMTNDASGPIVSDDSESDFKNLIGDKYKSLFLAFPQIQGESKDTENGIEEVKYPHIKDALSMLNNQPDNRFGAFADWLRGLNNVANDKQAKGEALPPERTLLAEIFSVMSEITGEPISLHEIVVREKGKDLIWVKLGLEASPILFDLVSQGYNNIFGWIGYFMKRLVEVTPEGEKDYKKTPGIVLIDEIDTYLHPKWQTKILAVLVDRFPNVQFVVTTHSPYVVGSVPSNQIAIFTCKKDGSEIKIEEFDEFTAYGANIERLSEKVFGVKGRFVDEVREKLSELSRLINEGNLGVAKLYLEEHFDVIDPNDPELQRSKMLIRTKEILAQ
ncbi:MAG: AAA family ATPase [Saprospirales bacterium]|nr:AAA family ATPase [Saprospirales bacterium]